MVESQVSEEIIFERRRKDFQVGFYQSAASDCGTKRLFDLEDNHSTSATLPFEELHFEYFVRIGSRLFLAWPLIGEAHLSAGYYIEFTADWSLAKVQPIE